MARVIDGGWRNNLREMSLSNPIGKRLVLGAYERLDTEALKT